MFSRFALDAGATVVAFTGLFLAGLICHSAVALCLSFFGLVAILLVAIVKEGK